MLGKQFNISYRVSAKRRKYRRIACRDLRIGAVDGCETGAGYKNTRFLSCSFFVLSALFLPEKSKKHYKENRK